MVKHWRQQNSLSKTMIFNCNNLSGKSLDYYCSHWNKLNIFFILLSINWHLIWHVDCMKIENICMWKKEWKGLSQGLFITCILRTLTHSNEGSATCPIQKPRRSDSYYKSLPRRVIFAGKGFSVPFTAPSVTYFWKYYNVN